MINSISPVRAYQPVGVAKKPAFNGKVDFHPEFAKIMDGHGIKVYGDSLWDIVVEKGSDCFIAKIAPVDNTVGAIKKNNIEPIDRYILTGDLTNEQKRPFLKEFFPTMKLHALETLVNSLKRG